MTCVAFKQIIWHAKNVFNWLDQRKSSIEKQRRNRSSRDFT